MLVAFLVLLGFSFDSGSAAKSCGLVKTQTHERMNSFVVIAFSIFLYSPLKIFKCTAEISAPKFDGLVKSPTNMSFRAQREIFRRQHIETEDFSRWSK